MKLRLVYCIVMISATSLLEARDRYGNDYSDKPARTKYKCYCSFKCGPRDVEETDRPFYDKEHGVCFCAPRDKDAYLENQCDLEHNTEFENNYCDMKNQSHR